MLTGSLTKATSRPSGGSASATASDLYATTQGYYTYKHLLAAQRLTFRAAYMHLLCICCACALPHLRATSMLTGSLTKVTSRPSGGSASATAGDLYATTQGYYTYKYLLAAQRLTFRTVYMHLLCICCASAVWARCLTFVLPPC
jgi:hypothetical protein